MSRPLRLIFDLDGTLVDSLPGIAAALNQALAARQHPTHSLEAVRGFVGSGATVLCRRALPADAGPAEIAALEHAFKTCYQQTWPEGTRPYPGIDPLLAALHQRAHPMAVLSNKPHAFVGEIVARLFPSCDFDPVVGQIDGSARKPDAAAVGPILRAWQARPTECVLIGDSDIDRQTAAAAGIPFIGVAWGYQPAACLGPRLAADPAQLAAQLAALQPA